MPPMGRPHRLCNYYLTSPQARIFIIENVPNLVRHNDGKTWAGIKESLEGAGYTIQDRGLSPHMFGIPQIRERAFIVGRRGELSKFRWPEPPKQKELTIRTVLDKRPSESQKLGPHFIKYLEAWQDFLDRFPKNEKLPSFPIWAMEFGATYPYEGKSPHARKFKRLGRYRGSFGKRLKGLSSEGVREALPPYARGKEKTFPDWKVDFIEKNRAFYQKHKKLSILGCHAYNRLRLASRSSSGTFRGKAANLGLCDSVPCIRHPIEKANDCPVSSRNDNEPSAGGRVGAPLHDPTGM